MATKPMPDPAYLWEIFHYNPDTGILRWRERPPSHFPARKEEHGRWNTRYAGREAGVLHKSSGHRRVTIDANDYGVHRIIWKYVTGREPTEEIDHRNRKRSDNRLENLREATREQNARNRRLDHDSFSGLKGAHQTPWGTYTSMIRVGEGYLYLGTFGTKEAAHRAYCHAAVTHYGEFWSPG